MTTIAITGAEGLIGWHLSCLLQGRSEVTMLRATRSDLKTPENIATLINKAAAVVHLAGVNRGSDDDVLAGNIALARDLSSAIEMTDRPIHVLFANSVHSESNTVYGQAKREAANILRETTESVGGVFTDLLLPHVFGEGGRPFYNSVVSTFCHQLAIGEVPVIDRDSQLNLIHAQTVAALFVQSVESHPRTSQQLRPSGSLLTVSELLKILENFVATYHNGIIPELPDNLTLDLFNTYRSYLYPSTYPVALVKRTDARGSLIEIVKGGSGGQSFISDSHPGVVRGNHYHLHKVERFVVLQGRAIIGIRRLFDDVVINFPVCGETPTFIDIPTMHPHNLTNIGSTDLVTMFWSHEIFNPDAPDTYPELVSP